MRSHRDNGQIKDPPGRYLSVRDLMDAFGVSRDTIERYRRKYGLPASKISGRVYFYLPVVLEWYQDVALPMEGRFGPRVDLGGRFEKKDRMEELTGRTVGQRLDEGFRMLDEDAVWGERIYAGCVTRGA